jgi:hypothetical protein
MAKKRQMKRGPHKSPVQRWLAPSKTSNKTNGFKVENISAQFDNRAGKLQFLSSDFESDAGSITWKQPSQQGERNVTPPYNCKQVIKGFRTTLYILFAIVLSSRFNVVMTGSSRVVSWRPTLVVGNMMTNSLEIWNREGRSKVVKQNGGGI